MEVKQFIEKIAPIIQKYYDRYKILNSLTIAQAILESNYGNSILATKANALFGIKADKSWTGKYFSKDTNECYDGKNMVTINANFRAYDSWEESIIDHCKFLQKNRYKNLIGDMDYKRVCNNIYKDGYATDPKYPEKLISLIEKYNLTKYDNVKVIERSDNKLKKIWIDEGHSSDLSRGASGNGIKEEEYVLDVGLKLGTLLKQNGFEVYYSRTNGNGMSGAKTGSQDLGMRCRKANEIKADLFISIHNNCATSTQANGIETLVYDQKATESIKLAKIVQSDLIKATGMTERGIKYRSDLCVLRETDMNSILIELGFLSNINDAKKLKSDGYKDLLADSICNSICAYYGMTKQKKNINTKDNDLISSIDKIVKHGVNINKESWNSIDKINLKNVEALIEKLGGIDKLIEMKVISNVSLWKDRKYTKQNVISLLKKYASKIK